MIIPAYNEDDILRELLDDYKSVQRKAKKIAMAELERRRNGFIVSIASWSLATGCATCFSCAAPALGRRIMCKFTHTPSSA